MTTNPQLTNVLPFHRKSGSVSAAWHSLASKHGITGRVEQRNLSTDIKDALVTGAPFVAEAPTGVGKTLAYLVGGIEASRITGTPLLVGTATVALQQQIIDSELPKLVSCGLVAAGEVALVKGRGRYFCPKQAENMRVGSSQLDMFADNSRVGAGAVAHDLLNRFNAGTWDGDRDTLTHTPAGWSEFCSESGTCLGQQCEMYRSGCPFFDSRRDLLNATVIIANHDLILSDFKAKSEGNPGPLPHDDYLVVFDEAHHLPEKAVSVAATRVSLLELDYLQGAIKALVVELAGHKDLRHHLAAQGLLVGTLISPELSSGVARLGVILETQAAGLPMLRLGALPADTLQILDNVSISAALSAASLRTVISGVQRGDPRGKQLISLLPLLSKMRASFERLALGAKGFAGGEVRWFELEAKSICSSPLSATDTLRAVLFENEGMTAAPVFLSATLRSGDGFKRYLAKCGLPADTQTSALPHAFDYGTSLLALPDIGNPKQPEFGTKSVAWLLSNLNGSEGTLVLFNSRKAMAAALPALRAKFAVLAQGDMSVRDLIAKHKARIDSGRGSVLCGLYTLSEGLDLPGDYCTHVVVDSLPFGFPDTPVEQARAEAYGSKYFGEHLLPDATTKLVQMVGRLVRRVTDRGTVSVLDNRLHTTNWGKKMMVALPPFATSIQQMGVCASTTLAATG